MILADTSIWVDHLRAGDPVLEGALDGGTVFVHPYVIGELACGRIGRRKMVLGLLTALPAVPVATDEEALRFIDTHELMGRGIGYVDAHLLASVALSAGVGLWTRDRRLRSVAVELGLSA